jgi:hypothetical protein
MHDAQLLQLLQHKPTRERPRLVRLIREDAEHAFHMRRTEIRSNRVDLLAVRAEDSFGRLARLNSRKETSDPN